MVMNKHKNKSRSEKWTVGDVIYILEKHYQKLSSRELLEDFLEEVKELCDKLESKPAEIFCKESYFKRLQRFYNTHKSENERNKLLSKLKDISNEATDRMNQLAKVGINLEKQFHSYLIDNFGGGGDRSFTTEEQDKELTEIYKEYDADEEEIKELKDYILFFEFYTYNGHVYVVYEGIDRPFNCFSVEFQKKVVDFAEKKFIW